MLLDASRCAAAVVLLVGCAPSIPEDKDTGSGSGTTSTDTDTDTDTDSETDSGDIDPDGDPVYESYRLYINELMASNSMATVDPDDAEATPDWVEIHNPSETDVDLTGFTVTDSLGDPGLYTLPELVVPAGGYLVLVADDTEGGVHLPFKLSAAADAFGLFSPEGTPLDQVTFSNLDDDQVAGRYPDDGPLALLSEPTPGASNDTAEVLER